MKRNSALLTDKTISKNCHRAIYFRKIFISASTALDWKLEIALTVKLIGPTAVPLPPSTTLFTTTGCCRSVDVPFMFVTFTI